MMTNKLAVAVQTKDLTPEHWKMDIGAIHGGFSSRTESERAKLVYYRATDSLEVHPLNAKIYGEPILDKEFLKSIETEGILEPIVLIRQPDFENPANYTTYVLSGHRRLAAAKKLGIKTVPCRYLPNTTADGRKMTQLQVEQYLILYNQQRVKTGVQLKKEVRELLRI